MERLPFAEPLKGAAKLIRADIGADVIAIDAGAWDLHTGYGRSRGASMQSSIAGLAQALAAFLDDLGARGARHGRDRLRVRPPGRGERQPGFDHGGAT